MISHSWQPPNGCKCFRAIITLTVLLCWGLPMCPYSLAATASSLPNEPSKPLSQASGGAAAGTSRSLLNTATFNNVASLKGTTAAPQQLKRPLVVPQCFWDPEGQVCDADDAVNIMYAIKARPMSSYLWFLLMTYDRETVCGQHTTASACRADTAHRCVYFDDILDIIGAPSSSSSSSSNSDSSSDSQSNSSSSDAKQEATAGGSTSSSRDEILVGQQDTVHEEAYMSLMSAWASSQFATTGSGNVYDSSALQRQLMEVLLSQHQLARQQLRQQPSPWEQQHLLQDRFLSADWMPQSALLAGQQQQQQMLFEVAAGSSSSSSTKPGSSSSSTKPGSSSSSSSSKTPAANPRASNSAAPKPAKESGTAKSSSSAQQQTGSSSSGAATPKKKAQILCTGQDLLENYIFTRSAYSNPLQAPLALHCPGSKAFDLIKCMRLPDAAACKETAGCVVVPGQASSSSNLCVSEYVHTLGKAAMRKFTYEVTLAEPSAVGSCDGACWMRQALLCNRTTSADACTALTFCRASPSGLCTPRLYTQDNFGSSVQEYMGECVDVDNEKDCEGLTLSLVNKGAYADWQMAAKAKWSCPVPSIGGLLGSKTDLQLQNNGHGYIAAAGYQEERAAGMQAAAAATAAAANAARLVLNRGPGMLQQIYFAEGSGPDTKGR